MKKLIITLITAAVLGLISCSPGSDDDSTCSPYITFKSSSPFYIEVSDPGWKTADHDGIIEYSKDTETWTEWKWTET